MLICRYRVRALMFRPFHFIFYAMAVLMLLLACLLRHLCALTPRLRQDYIFEPLSLPPASIRRLRPPSFRVTPDAEMIQARRYAAYYFAPADTPSSCHLIVA